MSTANVQQNGHATLLSPAVETDQARPGPASRLAAGLRKILSPTSHTVSWSEFVTEYLESGQVERLEVGHDGWARIRLHNQPGQSQQDCGTESDSGWWGWTESFRLPSLISWEAEEAGSTVSSSCSTVSGDSGVQDGSDSPGLATPEEQPVISNLSSAKKIFLQIGRPSYLERNLKLAYQRLNISPANYLHVVYQDRKHLGSSSNGLGAALFSLFLTILPIIIILKVGRDLKSGGSGSDGAMGGIAEFFTGGSATKAEVNPDSINVTFDDVAGCDEAKIEILEFVNFLKHPEQYIALGAKVPHGAILYGPPGTGKTLLAKAAAKEAGVPFLAQSGSEFTELFVGMGPLRMRSLFAAARSKAPCILFIDEIDAIGRKRGGKFQGGNNEEENTLNQLLSEMDGFRTGSSVIVLGATNRLDILDRALLRPGRFDRHIEVTVPDIKGRASIFRVHLAGITTELDRTDLSRQLAALTHGFTGAEIANVCNEAAIIAGRDGATGVALAHFKAAMERVVAGLEKRSRVLQPEERRRVALHEAGHAVTGWFLPHANPLLKVSIVPRGRGLGYALYQPEEKFLYTAAALADTMAMSLGGRAAEIIFFGDFSTGAQDDLRKVTESAYSQVVHYGMNEKVGHVSFDLDQSHVKPYSEVTAGMIDAEVRRLIQTEMDRALALLRERRQLVERLAEQLLEQEVLERTDMVTILGPRPWAEKTSYDDFVAGTGDRDGISSLPVGLQGWNSTELDGRKETQEMLSDDTGEQPEMRSTSDGVKQEL